MPSESALKFEHLQGVWIAVISTRYGAVEVVAGGSDIAPDEKQMLALEPFLARASEITEATRKKLRFPFLYQLIRIAPNQQGRVGLQFLNRLTGYQPLLFIDE